LPISLFSLIYYRQPNMSVGWMSEISIRDTTLVIHRQRRLDTSQDRFMVVQPRLGDVCLTLLHFLPGPCQCLFCIGLNLQQMPSLCGIPFCPQVVRATAQTVEVIAARLNGEVVNTDAHRREMHSLNLRFQELIALCQWQFLIHF